MKRSTIVCLLLLLFVCLYSCVSSRNAEPSRIGVLPLLHYSLSNAQLLNDTTYRVSRTSEEFSADFASSISNSRRPDFSSQMVVAVLLKDANRAGLHFDKAEIVGRTINIYMQSCTSPNEPTCMTGSLVMATIPKVGNANKVAFFVNGNSRFITGL